MKLLAIDMDGTCLNSKRKLPNETLDALIKAKEEGGFPRPFFYSNALNIKCVRPSE